MAIRIGHASIDENGRIAGGKVGDQTSKEICVRLWYDKDWDYYIECEDSIIANKAATLSNRYAQILTMVMINRRGLQVMRILSRIMVRFLVRGVDLIVHHWMRQHMHLLV
jgi:hypothetical protein